MTTVDLSEIEGAMDYVLDELSWAAKERDVARVKFLAEELAGLEEDWPTEFRKAAANHQVAHESATYERIDAELTCDWSAGSRQ